MHGYFQQDDATAHTVSRTLSRVHDVFDVDRTANRGSKICWPSRSPDLSPCDFYLWGKLKGQVYSNNPQTLEALEANISNAIAAITPEAELQRVFLNLSISLSRDLLRGKRRTLRECSMIDSSPVHAFYFPSIPLSLPSPFLKFCLWLLMQYNLDYNCPFLNVPCVLGLRLELLWLSC